MGQGPMTGRGLGPCGGGMAFGRGFGCRRFYTSKEEGEILKDEEKMLEQELRAIKERLQELKTKK
jgi:hypothetical protein